MQNDGSTTPLRVSVGADSDTRAFASLSPDSPKTQIRIFNLNGNKSTKPVPMYMFPRWVCFGEIVWCANSHSQSVSLIRHSFVSLMLIALCWICLNLYIHNRRFFGGVCLQTNRPINSIINSYLFNSVLMESNRWIFATCVWFVDSNGIGRVWLFQIWLKHRVEFNCDCSKRMTFYIIIVKANWNHRFFVYRTEVPSMTVEWIPFHHLQNPNTIGVLYLSFYCNRLRMLLLLFI